MNHVELSEILGLGEYESIRERFRARIIEEKKQRRVRLGDRASCVFENHDTALYQVQEMLRTERITKKDSILHEIATYNELVPASDELSVTIMIEIDDKDERDRFLAAGLGMEKSFHLLVGGARVPATWDPERVHDDHLSAVLYLKFPLGKTHADEIRAGNASISLAVDHPAYNAKVDLPLHVVRSLKSDLE